MYDVDTEHINGEGYGMWRDKQKNESMDNMVWVYVLVFLALSVFIGWMLAVAIGGA